MEGGRPLTGLLMLGLICPPVLGDAESAVSTAISIVRLIPDPDYEPEEDME